MLHYIIIKVYPIMGGLTFCRCRQFCLPPFYPEVSMIQSKTGELYQGHKNRGIISPVFMALI